MAVYRLITLGGLSLERDGQPVTALAGQRRALGLLAVLACAGPRGVARDRLMLLFWPESSTSRARGSLKQLLHTVRRQLGNADIIGGVTDLHLQSDQITSDVAEFRERITRGDDEAAATLYAGPFLDGVFLDGCDEFERWAADERASLAVARAACLERLALAAEAGDRAGAAVRWWRELQAAEPLNTRVTLGLMRALVAAGDPAGAVLQARAHAAATREELGAPPDGEVVALADSLMRPASHGTQASPARAGSDGAGEPPIATGSERAGEPAMGTGSERGVPAWGTGAGAPARPASSSRRWRLTAGVGLLFAVALAAAQVIRSRALRSADGMLLPNRVAVAIFVNRTGSPELDALGTMTSDWVARGLTRVPGAYVFDVGGLYIQGRRPGGEPVDPRALARRNGAGIVVAGNYYRAGDTLTFSAQVIDVASGRILRALEPIRAGTDAPLDGVEEVRQRIEVALGTILDPRASLLASPAMAPPSYDAFAAFVAGQERYWQGDWSGSLPLFREAAALDTTFTAALTFLGVVGVGTARCDLADSVLRVLTERRDRVQPIELVTARISVARCASDHREHNRLQRERAALLPGSKAVQLTMSTGYRQLNQPAEALAILSNIDPARDLGWLPDRGRSFFWRELAANEHALGDYSAERAVARRMEEAGAARLAAGLFRVRSFAGLGLPDSVLAAADAVRDAPPDPAMLSGVTGGLEPLDLATPGWVVFQAAVELAAHGFPDASRIAAERTVGWYRQSPQRSSAAGTYVLARALELTGRYSEALDLLEGLAGDHPESVDFQGLIGIVSARSGDEQTALRIDAWLAARRNVFPPGLPILYRAGIAAVRGDTAAAMQLILSLPQGAHPHDFLQFHVDPAFATLRDNAAFRRFLVARG